MLMTCIIGSVPVQYGTSQEALPHDKEFNVKESCDYSLGDTREFHICIGNKRIGEYKTSRYKNGPLTYYCGESEVKIWLFANISIRYELECMFTDSFLLYSRCVGYRNDRQRLDAEIIRDGTRWKARQDSGPWYDHAPVTSTMIKLYYEEPVVGDMTVIEATLVQKEVISEEGGMYILREPGKKRVSEVIYHNGEISRVNVHYALMDFSVVSKATSNEQCECK